MAVCVVAVSAVALGASACGSSNKLDTNAVEQNILDRVDKRKVPLEKVTCPDDIEAKEGTNFRCQADITGGKQATVNVVQTDDNGTVEYKFELPPDFKVGENQSPTR